MKFHRKKASYMRWQPCWIHN